MDDCDCQILQTVVMLWSVYVTYTLGVKKWLLCEIICCLPGTSTPGEVPAYSWKKLHCPEFRLGLVPGKGLPVRGIWEIWKVEGKERPLVWRVFGGQMRLICWREWHSTPFYGLQFYDPALEVKYGSFSDFPVNTCLPHEKFSLKSCLLTVAFQTFLSPVTVIFILYKL